MKTVVFSIVAASILLVSCKNEPNGSAGISSQGLEPENELAIADTSIETPGIKTHYVYVTARSGLSLRAFNNLNSDKLAKMPYGTKVKVINAEKEATMTVAGIQGSMDEVEYNHKSGYAFNGYLSKFFPPEQEINPKGYAEELKLLFPKVEYSESHGGTASKPSNTQTISLPTDQWHEAFFIAQQVFDFPREFEFPNAKGKDEEVISGRTPSKDKWTNELRITRKANKFQQIQYVHVAKKFSQTVTISQEDGMIHLSKTAIVE